MASVVMGVLKVMSDNPYGSMAIVGGTVFVVGYGLGRAFVPPPNNNIKYLLFGKGFVEPVVAITAPTLTDAILQPQNVLESILNGDVKEKPSVATVAVTVIQNQLNPLGTIATVYGAWKNNKEKEAERKAQDAAVLTPTVPTGTTATSTAAEIEAARIQDLVNAKAAREVVAARPPGQDVAKLPDQPVAARPPNATQAPRVRDPNATAVVVTHKSPTFAQKWSAFWGAKPKK